MTLDASYLRGSVAAVHSLLKHAACPDLLFFHFIAAKSDNSPALWRAIISAFPNLHFQIYRLAGERLAGLISPSVRAALENPLNYARTYLADLLPFCVRSDNRKEIVACCNGLSADVCGVTYKNLGARNISFRRVRGQDCPSEATIWGCGNGIVRVDLSGSNGNMQTVEGIECHVA